MRDGHNLISWRWSLPLPKNPVWSDSMYIISSYRGNRPTHTQTHPHTNRQDRLQYTAPLLASAHCNEWISSATAATYRRLLTPTLPLTAFRSDACHEYTSQQRGLRPSVLRQDQSETKKIGLGLGLAGFLLCCETQSCHARRRNDLGGHSSISSTIFSFSILCLEHHYRGDQQLAFTYLKVKSENVRTRTDVDPVSC